VLFRSIGAVLLGLAVLAILCPFVESGGSGLWWLTLPAGIVILLGWLSWEKRYRDRGKSPMVDLQIFRVSSFANGTLIMGLWFLGDRKSEEHTSELQSRFDLVCRLLLEKKKSHM